MKNTQKNNVAFRRIIDCYRNLPHDLRYGRPARKKRAQNLLILSICIPIMLATLGYTAHWEATRASIERNNAAFSALYLPEATPQTDTSLPVVTPLPTQTPSPLSTAAPTQTVAPQSSATVASVPATQAAAQVTQTTTPSVTPVPFEIASDATRAPLATPDADTIVLSLETPPPTQNAFADLLALNPDTVAFLRIDDFLSLPVVQRANDNQYYLNHSFDNEESNAGTLFLDGSNLLVPEDKNLIVYGHNMRNGTMFRPLLQYEQLSFLKTHPLVRFDTLYQNRDYVPFAVFTVTADAHSDRYLNLRQFLLDEADWSNYIADMRRLSIHDIPVDVCYDDHVLLLVTCEYTHDNGRFVVALRALREDETRADMIEQVQNAK